MIRDDATKAKYVLLKFDTKKIILGQTGTVRPGAKLFFLNTAGAGGNFSYNHVITICYLYVRCTWHAGVKTSDSP